MKTYEYLKKQEGNFLRVFNDIVSLESPSNDKSLNDKLADYLENLFNSVCKVQRISQKDCGDNLRIEFSPKDHSDNGQIMILCHMDTVWDKGEIEKRPFTVEGNKILGPGVYDMKFGIVQAFFAIKAIAELNISIKNKVVVYINSDEETGSHYSSDYLKKEALDSKCVIVLEPSEESGFAKTERKGMFIYNLKCFGKSAHAGAFHQDGASAIKELANKILEIEALTDYTERVTSNVGIISGGSRVNVIPDQASASIDIRYPTIKKGLEIERFMNNLKPSVTGTSIELTLTNQRPPLEKNEGNQKLYQFVLRASDKLGLPMGEISVGGLSDGNTTSALGIPTIDGMGAIGSNSHSLDEFVSADKIIERVLLLTTLIEELNSF